MKVSRRVRMVRAWSTADLLRWLGFERRALAVRYAATVLGLVGACAVGCLAGLLLAPRSGRELMARVRERVRRGRGGTEWSQS